MSQSSYQWGTQEIYQRIKIEKKTSIRKGFHKKLSRRPYQWGIQVSYKKLEENFSIKIISTINYPKDCNNDSTKERY